MYIYAITIILVSIMFTKGHSAEEYNPEQIKSELLEKYNAFNGKLEDQTVEMWDTYFLNSPNIGNMHESRPEIGWEAVHQESVQFVKSKPKGEMKFENMVFYPINSNTAWVKAKMSLKINGHIFIANMFDSLIKTDKGWRVILSVVTQGTLRKI